MKEQRTLTQKLKKKLSGFNKKKIVYCFYLFYTNVSLKLTVKY